MKATVPYSGLPTKFQSQMEEDYFDHLAMLALTGEIREFWYESFKVCVGVGTGRTESSWYMPDFCVVNERGEWEFHETKGSKRMRGIKASIVRLECAARQYPQWRWFYVDKGKHGEWQYKELRA